MVDRHIAAVLDKLDEKGLTDDTVIFRFADHGEQGWSHQMIQKGLNSYQETINVPLIISNPKLFPKGTTTSSFASLIDLVPTRESREIRHFWTPAFAGVTALEIFYETINVGCSVI